MQPIPTIRVPVSRRKLLPLLIALTVTGIPATAQTNSTPIAPQTTTASLVTKSDLQATGKQLGQKVPAQADGLVALSRDLLALKLQLEALDGQMNGVKVPTIPQASRMPPGH